MFRLFRGDGGQRSCGRARAALLRSRRTHSDPSPRSRLSAEARSRESLQTLGEHIERGQFPRNFDFQERTPLFIDANGTPCAVAYLMLESGWTEDARANAQTQNNAYVA